LKNSKENTAKAELIIKQDFEIKTKKEKNNPDGKIK
jgi:hypothetical protein